jgi:phosphoribosyl-ATP pyrophosphohydrolase
MTQQPSDGIFDELMETIIQRKSAAPQTSYTASLFSGGVHQICSKISEEAAELVEAAKQVPGSRQQQVHESADLIYHVWVLLAQQNIPLSEIRNELARRFGISGLEEKASRTDPSCESDKP